MFVALIMYVCSILQRHNGTQLPLVFRAVLYLDVFGWLQHKTSVLGDAPEECSEQLRQPQSRPVSSLRGPRGESPLFRPEDAAPRDKVEDCRSLPGAPRGRGRDGTCFNTSTWLGDRGAADEADDEPKLPRDEHDAPRTLPHLIFSGAMGTLCFAWIAASVFHGLVAIGFKPLWQLSRHYFVFEGMQLSLEVLPVDVAWPNNNVAPQTLACDRDGRRLMATDGMSLFSASIESVANQHDKAWWTWLGGPAQPTVAAKFTEVFCDTLSGQGIQDVALQCDELQGCRAVALYRHGGRLANCLLDGSGGGSSANISDAWLQRLRTREPGSNGMAYFIEKAIAVTTQSGCSGSWTECLLLGTSRGRVVSLRQAPNGSSSSLLLPLHSFRDGLEKGEASWGLGSLRTAWLPEVFTSRGGQRIRVLDGQTGSTKGRFDLPQSSSRAAGFCFGGGYLYLLEGGPSPRLWRIPMPEAFRTSD